MVPLKLAMAKHRLEYMLKPPQPIIHTGGSTPIAHTWRWGRKMSNRM